MAVIEKNKSKVAEKKLPNLRRYSPKQCLRYVALQKQSEKRERTMTPQMKEGNTPQTRRKVIAMMRGNANFVKKLGRKKMTEIDG